MQKLFTIFLVLTPLFLFCDDFKETYHTLLNNKEFTKLDEHLSEWSKQKPEDPEMFIAYFNYYIYRNVNDVIDTVPSNDKKYRASIQGRRIYNKEDVLLGISYLDKALKKYPFRLDIHIGKINMLQNIEEFDTEIKQISQIISLMPKYKEKWQWAEGKLESNFDNNFQNDIQQRINFFFRQNDKKMWNFAKIISEMMMKPYPKNVWWVNNIAGTYFFQEDYNNAIKYFKLGEKINPNDEIILFNIGYCYDQLKDKKNAIKYYEKVKNSSNERILKKATTRLEELQK